MAEDKKIVLLKKESLRLKCDWKDCDNYETTSMDEFMFHIDAHLSTVKETKNLVCNWYGCSFVSGTRAYFNRHIYYHGYHTKVKSLGANLIIRKGITEESCTAGIHGRNLIPEIKEDFRCNWTDCQESFCNPELFYNHVNQHAENGPKGNNPKGGVSCLWTGCDCTFQSKYKLREHLRSHSQEKIIACPFCGSLFASRTKLFDHIKRQVPVGMQEYQCSHCSKWFSSERLLRDHMRTHVNHYKCPYCDMTCPSLSSLNTHIKYRHSEEKPYSCEYCDYSCKSDCDLRRHMYTHCIEAPYKCSFPDCTFAARSFQSLNNHNRKIHEQSTTCRYRCHICEKKFSRGAYLTRHLIKEHKFRWPSGHSRFRYKCNDEGFYHLQTVRYESIELIQEMMDNQIDDPSTSEEIVYEEATSKVDSVEIPILQEDDNQESYLMAIEQAEDGTYVMKAVIQDDGTNYTSESITMESTS